MSDSPPLYPLLNKVFPSSCQYRENDHFVLNNSDVLIDRLSKASFKRRMTLDDSTFENKRIMLEEDHNIPNQPLTSHNTDVLMRECDDEDQDVDNIPILNNNNNNNNINNINNNPNGTIIITATNNTIDEDPLPSPSESPKQTYVETEPVLDSLRVINLIENFSTNSLTANSQRYLALKLLSKLNRSVLSDFNDLLTHNLKRDIVSSLPFEVSVEILKNLDYNSLMSVQKVSKKWSSLITEDFWQYLLIKENFITDEELSASTTNTNTNANTNTNTNSKPSNYFRDLYRERYRLYSNWTNPSFIPKRISARGHGPNVVTCLQFDESKIITGADDNMINIYNPDNGELLTILQGHEGGVWALKYIGNQIISGSTDRTVRIWNMNTGKCTHIFRGHTSTIRCMEIVELDGETLIVTGSRDNTLHVWRLPEESDDGHYDLRPENNPYFVCTLQGHTGSVRSVTGKDNIIISGSYDNTVRVWDLRTRRVKYILSGHTDRIYSTVYDHRRNRCISASMDATIRVWDLATGECIHVMKDHTSLVGLLGLSKNYLISAAADGTLRGWNPVSFSNDFTFHHDNHSAITTFDSNPNILVSGSEGQFNVYDLKSGGRLIRSKLLSDAGQIWSTKFSFDKCVVAVEKNQQSFIEILDFS